MSSHNDHQKGLLITAIGGLTLTVDIPLIRLADGGAWTIMLLRTGTTFIAAMIIWSAWRALSRNAPPLIPGWSGLIVAICYGLTSITFVTAVFHTSTADLVFILAFNTVFTALLSWIFLKESPRPATIAAMLIMILGVLVIVGGSVGTGKLFGDFMALCSAFFVALAITITRASGKDMGFTSLVGVLLPLALAAFMVTSEGFHVNAPSWIIFNGAVVMPISFFCLAAAPKYISGPEVAMFYLLETVLAPVWVWMIFAETPAHNTLIGGGILIVTLIAHSLWQLLDGRKRHTELAVHHPA